MLKNIVKPTLLIQSSNDSLAAPEIGAYMAENITDSQLEIIEAEGHCLHMTDATLLTPIVIDFINNHNV